MFNFDLVVKVFHGLTGRWCMKSRPSGQQGQGARRKSHRLDSTDQAQRSQAVQAGQLIEMAETTERMNHCNNNIQRQQNREQKRGDTRLIRMNKVNDENISKASGSNHPRLIRNNKTHALIEQRRSRDGESKGIHSYQNLNFQPSCPTLGSVQSLLVSGLTGPEGATTTSWIHRNPQDNTLYRYCSYTII